MGELDVHVLGPVEVIAHGQVLPLGRGTVTDLLAALAVSPNRVLPAQALAETMARAAAGASTGRAADCGSPAAPAGRRRFHRDPAFGLPVPRRD